MSKNKKIFYFGIFFFNIWLWLKKLVVAQYWVSRWNCVEWNHSLSAGQNAGVAPLRFLTSPSSPQPATLHVVPGQNVTLECAAAGSPLPVITWERANTADAMPPHELILGNLRIPDFEAAYAGGYVCIATNGDDDGTGGGAIRSPRTVSVAAPPNFVTAVGNDSQNSDQGVTAWLGSHSRCTARWHRWTPWNCSGTIMDCCCPARTTPTSTWTRPMTPTAVCTSVSRPIRSGREPERSGASGGETDHY